MKFWNIFSGCLIFVAIIAAISPASFKIEKKPTGKKLNQHLSVFPQKGIYSTVWTARAKRINDLIRIVGETEINSIVIDVKDNGVYIDDYLINLVKTLREKNIYTIARIVLFQDGSQINFHP